MRQLLTVIPAYNASAYLGSTLEALRQQELQPDRVVLLDDCSTDDTRAVAAAFPGLKVEVAKNGKNLGLFPNHNRALEYADQTDFLHILHANDLIKPTFYSKLLAALDSAQGRAMGFTNYDIVDDAGALVRTAPSKGLSNLSTRDLLISQSELKSLLIDAVILKTDRKPSPCQFRLDLPHLGDVMFHAEWARCCERIVCVDEPLCSFRQHRTGATRDNIKNLAAWVTDEWRVMEAVAAMIQEPMLSRHLRLLKLKCLFAARSRVKVGMTGESHPEFAQQVRQVTKERVGKACWLLGTVAVKARDIVARAQNGLTST